jgi:hypothetical protein
MIMVKIFGAILLIAGVVSFIFDLMKVGNGAKWLRPFALVSSLVGLAFLLNPVLGVAVTAVIAVGYGRPDFFDATVGKVFPGVGNPFNNRWWNEFGFPGYTKWLAIAMGVIIVAAEFEMHRYDLLFITIGGILLYFNWGKIVAKVKELGKTS